MTTLSPLVHRDAPSGYATVSRARGSTAEVRSRSGWPGLSSALSPDRARVRVRVRAMVLLLAYLVGSAAVAALLAVGLGVVWQEIFDWALPYLTPRSLPG